MRTVQLLKFDLIYNIWKKPMILVYMFIMPISLFYLLHVITGGNFGSFITSADYYGISVLVFFQLNLGTMAVNMLMEEEVKRPNMRIAYALKKIDGIYMSKIITLSITNLLSVTFYMLVGYYVFHINFGSNPIAVHLICDLLGLISIMLGIFLSALLNNESATNNILGLTQVVLCILGGLFFPINGLGKVVESISKLSIVKWIFEGIIEYIYDSTQSKILLIGIICLGIVAVLRVCIKKAFRIERYI